MDGKKPDEFRNYGTEDKLAVTRFYNLNHRYQTYDFVLAKKQKYLMSRRKVMGIWEAMEYLNTLVDDSDPDTGLTQMEHLVQTAEAIRAAKLAEWMVLTGLIHDLGKILCLFGEPQWAVVGDTFPVGCAFSPDIVYAEFFSENGDTRNPRFRSDYGIYSPHCGLDNITFSWGHDEYLYHVVKSYLPPEALWMIRYHSAYVIHQKNGYRHLLAAEDDAKLASVRLFNPFDLYSKADKPPDIKKLRPYYEALISSFFPPKIAW